MGAVLERFKQKHGIVKNSDLAAVIGVFSLAGMSISFTVRPLYHYTFHHIHGVPFFLRVIAYICVAVPIYQCFLLIYGGIFGQFKFFWERAKKLGRWFRRLFLNIGKGIAQLFGNERTQESEYI